MPFGLTNAPTTFMDLMHKFEDFSRLAAPMTRLTRKEVRFTWDDSCEQPF